MRRRRTLPLRLQRRYEAHRLARGAADEGVVAHHDAAADNGEFRPAGDAHAVEGRPAAAAGDPAVLDDAARLEVDDGEVRVVAEGDAPLAGDAVDARGPGAGEIDEALEA